MIPALLLMNIRMKEEAFKKFLFLLFFWLNFENSDVLDF